MDNDRISKERSQLVELASQPVSTRLKAYTKLCGPGWLQAAITLGGGSLSSALFLGVLTGYSMMWLQPLAMIMGIIMLSAISYVTLSTEKRPFREINEHISPVLGWGWLIATLMANIVWCLPQFALGTAAVKQNLIPSLAQSDIATYFIVAGLLAVALVVIWFYDSGSRGIQIFENILKGMVGLVVLCFLGVAVSLTLTEGGLPWGKVFKGFVPNLGLLSSPAAGFSETLVAAGDSAPFWKDRIVGQQQGVIMAAFATAVGINMTFLLPYSMLKKGWGREHRGLAIFDLSTGLLIPFMIATGCVVIAAASQFHAQAKFEVGGEVNPKVAAAYAENLDALLGSQHGAEVYAGKSDAEKQKLRAGVPQADREVAAMIVKRDAWSLAVALQP
ncbi:MAG: divalent metal cation transporter, partial [Verrucomicrobiales bacterium]